MVKNDDPSIDFKYEYLFLKTNKNKFSELDINIQNIIKNTQSIHIYQINHQPFIFDVNLTNNIYIYTFNALMEQSCINNGYIPHFCFKGDNLLSEIRKQELFLIKNFDEDIEVFWFPDDNNITFDIEPFMEVIQSLKNINTAICISFSDIFNNPINPDKYNFLKNILQSYKNPLFEKEKSLLENEKFSDKNIFIDELSSNEIQPIVLGLFGDYPLSLDFDLENLTNKSKQILLKNKTCLFCENFQFCSQRGIGVIQNENKLNLCQGISLFFQ